jgi:hypothetical protein
VIVKRYRLKKGEYFLQLNSDRGCLQDKKALMPGESAVRLQNMTRFDWLYGEAGKDPCCIILHVPYMLPYVELLVAVFKSQVEEIPE